MAGPAIRASELARVLAGAGHEVTLAAPSRPQLPGAPFSLAAYDRRALRALAAAQDVIVLQGWALERFPGLARAGGAVAVDLYDPFALELLVLLEGRPAPEREQAQANALRALRDQLRVGDFFMCASERQRDYWLGWLEALGRLNPRTHGQDPSLRALIDVVPFGVPEEPPRRRGQGPRAAFGLEADDVVLLWSGGIYDWFDPVTVVRAAEQAAARQQRLRLVFMAGRHANAGLPQARVLAEARRAAGAHVLFGEEWVEYERRADWLLDADVGVSAHFDAVETRLAFRTRLLDYLWAGLPVLCTAGDTLAGEVEQLGMGEALAPGDVDAWAAAMARLAADPAARAHAGERARGRAAQLAWPRVAGPLVDFCAAPRRAPDLAAGGPLRPTRERPLSRRWLAERLRGLRGRP
jgi:glycosyltransferase involved in cell wall biosynthesis